MNETKSPLNHLTIGEFARLSRLSLKALRLYDAMGLLLPAHVDEASGYRYYLETQLERAKLIGLLRQLEMPLQTIAEVLDKGGAEAAKEIGQWWGGVEAHNREKRGLVHYLRDYLQGQGETMYEVQTREVPEQKVLSIQRKMYVRALPSFIQGAGDALFGYLTAAGLQPSGAALVIYHGTINEDSDGPVEVCVPFEGSLEPSGEIAIRIEPAHSEAYTRITKAQVEFPSILKAYDAVGNWLAANNLPVLPNGCSPREVYFADWSQIGPDDPACDIAFPYQVPL